MPVDSRISPHFSDEKYKTGSLEDLIDVLDDRVRYWLLAPARALLGVPFGGTAALSLLFGYFEAHAIYRTGRDSTKRSKQFFCDGFVEVFSNSGVSKDVLRRVAELIYVDGRCGIFHEGMARERIYVGKGKRELLVTLPRVGGKMDESGAIESVVIDPEKFWLSIEQHFARYVQLLRDAGNSELRQTLRRLSI
jgi:hypothetical protein